MKATRSRFDTITNTARWLLTSGLQFFLQFWHSKNPVFTYPRGWLPWQVEWVLGFPRAPYGSVSVNVWGAVCGVVVTLVGDTIGSVISATTSKQQQAGKGRAKMPMKADGPIGEKKEL